MEPCGTPYLTHSLPHLVLLTLHAWYLLVRYDRNHEIVASVTPAHFSFSNSSLWSTLSNAFFRSRKSTPLTTLISLHWYLCTNMTYQSHAMTPYYDHGISMLLEINTSKPVGRCRADNFTTLKIFCPICILTCSYPTFVFLSLYYVLGFWYIVFYCISWTCENGS